MKIAQKSKRLGRRRGMALVVVLALVAILGVLTGVVGNQAGLALDANKRQNEQDSAHYVAYGGMQRTLLYLRTDSSYPGGKGKTFPGKSGAKYSVEIIRNKSTTKNKKTSVGVSLPPLTTMVVCTGTVSDSSRTLAGIVTNGSGGSGFGALAKSQVKLHGGLVDAFDAGPGNSFLAADIVNVPNAAQVGTDGGMTILEPKLSDGTAAVLDGELASDSVDGDPATIEGGVYSIDATATIGGEKQLTAPPALDGRENVVYSGGSSVNAVGGDALTLSPGHYGSLAASFNSTVTLQAGDYYFADNIEIFDQAQVKINGQVRIFAQKLIMVADTGSINKESDPNNLEIVATGQDTGSYPWLSGSRNFSRPVPIAPSGFWAHSGTADHGEIWGKYRGVDSKIFLSGSIYGDVQADSIEIYGDSTRTSGAIHYYTGLGGGGSTPNPGANPSLVYDSIWVAR